MTTVMYINKEELSVLIQNSYAYDFSQSELSGIE